MQDSQVLPNPHPIPQYLMEPEGGRWWIVGDGWMAHDSGVTPQEGEEKWPLQELTMLYLG